jgi:hypothetical protein
LYFLPLPQGQGSLRPIFLPPTLGRSLLLPARLATWAMGDGAGAWASCLAMLTWYMVRTTSCLMVSSSV